MTKCVVLIEFYDGVLQVCVADSLLSCFRGANLMLLPISLIKKLHQKAVAKALSFPSGICHALTSVCVRPLTGTSTVFC